MHFSEQLNFIGYYSVYKPTKKVLIFLYLIVSACIQVFTSFWIQEIVDTFVESAVIHLQKVIFFVLSISISAICQFSRKAIVNKISFLSESRILSKILYNKFINGNLANRDITAGEMNSMLLVRIREYRNFLMENFENLFYRPLIFIFSVIAMLLLDFKISSIVLVCVILSAIFNVFFGENIIEISGEFYKKQSDFFQYQKELVDQYDVTIMSGIKKKALNFFREKAENLQRAEVKLLKSNQRAYIPALLNEYIPTIVYLLLLMTNINEISYGKALALLSIVSGISLPLSHALRSFVVIRKWIPFMTDVKNMVKEESVTILSQKEMMNNCLIEFEKVHFTYDEKQLHLNVENLQIFRGDKIAIVGQSGSGKTTLLKLIMGILNAQNGTVFIASNANEEVVDLKKFWKKISYIDNNTCILSGTLCYNITFCDTVDNLESKERYYKILDQFNLHEFNNKEIWQFGKNLSGGQKMKVCLARALYKSADIIILDEPMASLDIESEQELIKILQEISETIIIVTHRKDVLRICNRVLCVEDGVVNEY